MRHVLVWLALVAVVTLSCEGQGSLMPSSGGRPYEVLLFAASGNGRGVVAVDSILSQDVPGLPQKEPMFDVSVTDSVRFNQIARLARSIVIVNVNPHLFTRTMIRYERNVWAKPQIVVYLNAASDSALVADMPRMGKHFTELLVRSEISGGIARIGLNAKASGVVGEMFGYDMKIPAGMKSSKRGRGFVWFSDNAPDGMSNICIYSYAGDSLDPVRALHVRDSVMKVNIPGERAGVYMQTDIETVSSGMVAVKGRRMMVCRGLWSMKGDAMGGPFVSHSVVDSTSRRIVVAEAFVYAPGMKKRNLLRQVEAVLYTMKKVKK